MVRSGRAPRNFEYLRELSVQRLEELLTMDFPGGEEDEALVEAVIQELLAREDAAPTGRLPDVDQAWEDFQTHYNTPEGDGLSLYPAEPEARKSERRRPRMGRTWAKTALAACLVLVLLAALVPPALGYTNLVEMVARWTDRSFSFAPDSGGAEELNPDLLSKEPKERYDTLQEALEDYEITERVLPTWLPEKTILSTVSVQTAPVSKSIRIHAAYFNSITIQVVRHFDPSAAYTYGKDGEPVEVYTVEKIEHYLFENGGQLQGVWRNGSLECAISGEMSRDTLKRIIRSIYEEDQA